MWPLRGPIPKTFRKQNQLGSNYHTGKASGFFMSRSKRLEKHNRSRHRQRGCLSLPDFDCDPDPDPDPNGT
jgi:hypothetical protein